MLAVSESALILFPNQLAAQRTYTIAPPPGWVHTVPVDLTAPSESGVITYGSELLLIDRQDNAVGEEFEFYTHLAYRLLTEGAVQNSSQIEIEVDTSYQRLTLHGVSLIRGGRVLDQLKPEQIQVMRRETRMEFQLYDGSLSLVMLLQDVRQGDVVEYSFTRSGSNPVMGRHFMSSVGMQSSIPIHRLFFRVLWPNDRQLFINGAHEGLDPTVHSRRNYLEYVWDRTDVPAKLIDSGTPYWYEPFPRVQLSDFESWAAVAGWGSSLFDVPIETPPELTATIDGIRASSPTTTGRVQGALQFVQDEIRYLGLEIGTNSHIPQPPSTVLQRRFGDCKDKSLLLTTMLDQLGVHAFPALVSTRYRSHVGEYHPSAALFNHMIVRAEFDGQVYWLDPSILHERGSLEQMTAEYGSALVLNGTTNSLSTIQPVPSTGPSTDISVELGLRGMGEPASMRVRTVYSRNAANQTRRTFKNTSVESLEKQYLEYYSRLYPSIESAAPLEVVDLEEENVIRLVENYSVVDFWTYSEEYGENIGEFYPLELGYSIPSGLVGARNTPLGVTHPVHIRYEIEAILEDGWSISPVHEVIETPAVRFTYDVKAAAKVLTIAYEYETLADHVSADSAAEHVRKINEMRDLLTFSVYAPSDEEVTPVEWSAEELNWLVIILGLFVLGVAIYAGVRVYKLEPTSWPQVFTPDAAGPRGLGGWLVVLGIGMVLVPFVLSFNIISTLPSFAVSNWNALTTPGWESYHPLWAPVLIFELSAYLVLLVFSVVQLVAYLNRRRVFPGLYIVWALTGLAVAAIDEIVASRLPGMEPFDLASSGLARSAITTLIWVSYMFRSERVRNTFTD